MAVTDPRYYQIFIIATFLAVQLLWSDFGPGAAAVLVTLVSVCLWQVFFLFLLSFPRRRDSKARFSGFRIPVFAGMTKRDVEKIFVDLLSPFITGLSIALLFRAPELWFFPLAAFVAIGSKFLIRVDNKHVFNPSNIAIVVLLLLFPHEVWISPGQWGRESLMGLFIAGMAFLVLSRISKADIAVFFLGAYAALIFGRALWLGDPMGIPLLQMQNGALLVFAFFMMTDPKPIPDQRTGRLIFALVVALIGFTLQFGFQIREGLFYALALVSMSAPLIDRFLPGQHFEWRTT